MLAAVLLIAALADIAVCHLSTDVADDRVFNLGALSEQRTNCGHSHPVNDVVIIHDPSGLNWMSVGSEYTSDRVFSLGALSEQRTSCSQLHPVTKVINLLKDMHAQLEKETTVEYQVGWDNHMNEDMKNTLESKKNKNKNNQNDLVAKNHGEGLRSEVLSQCPPSTRCKGTPGGAGRGSRDCRKNSSRTGRS